MRIHRQTRPARSRVFHGLRRCDDGLFQFCCAIDVGLIDGLGARLLSACQHDFLPPLAGLGVPGAGKQGGAPEQILKKLRKGQHPCCSDSAEEMERLRQEMGDGQI